MTVLNKILVHVVIISMICTTGISGLKCYKCTPSPGSDCSKPNQDEVCPTELPMSCYKKDMGAAGIARMCMLQGGIPLGCSPAGCYCNTDLCNGSSNIKSVFALLVVLLISLVSIPA